IKSTEKQSQRPPPLHTGADWKVVLHLPEIEKWLRATSDRVTQLSHSVGQDGENRHVDVHLVQLKDICEDISDHVEQIHALLETEFSLKLLSYSVNIIVDIRTVQLLWHQLRVSVLVLKERLLQGLQDPNGNYTRQTDILQAFSQDQHQTRLDALTDVDDCGQLTIRCSQNYFSLDCGITAFELSDYSPGDEPEDRGTEPGAEDPGSDQDLDPEPGLEESQGSQLSNHKLHNSLPELLAPGDSINHAHTPSGLPTMQCGTSIHSESAKRPLQGVSLSTDVSPTQPSLPKRAALFSDGGTSTEETRGRFRKVNPLSGLQFQAELSRSTPSLMDLPDRTKFWLELHSVYPEHISQSYDSLQVQQRILVGGHPETNARPEEPVWGCATRCPPPSSTSGGSPRTNRASVPRLSCSLFELMAVCSVLILTYSHRSRLVSENLQVHLHEVLIWFFIFFLVLQKAVQVSSKSSPNREHWYGSEEFLALPDQLRKTEMLAMNLERLKSYSVFQGSAGCDSTQDALQDVDDWDLTELNPEWDVGESGDDVARNHVGRFSPASSSDMAPSLDDSIESGPFSDLTSEDDEGRRSAERRPRPTAPLVDAGGSVSLVQQLLEDVQRQNKDPDVWKKIECFVQQLDGFIWWLQEALDSTENWTQPRQDLDSLRAYLDTHLSFKLNVDSRTALKDSITEEGRALLSIITSHQSALKDILQMVSGQWDQLQRQIRRQHGWMLRALRCIQARLFYTGQSHEAIAVSGIPTANRALISSQFEGQRAALEQMAIRLSSLQYPTSTSRRQNTPQTKNNSLQEFEAEYQELWDWLMDMDAMVTDSHQLMMSEEQRHHLFKVRSSHAELMAMETRRTSVLGRAESLKRSGSELPAHFHRKVHNLTHTWTQLETSRSALSPLTNSLLEQLEARIKELKAWLRDTELLIFNSCLRQDKDATAQLGSFKSLCSEIRARRRGVSSVLKLCQKLLQQSQVKTDQALQLLVINPGRRWEAIVMQALQEQQVRTRNGHRRR
uniref:A kinase (PRKA) anchor protein 6 n=1 Tax=Sphaeramia orbicularis TaxID=375764 RepID=A0A673CJ06_9TELE